MESVWKGSRPFCQAVSVVIAIGLTVVFGSIVLPELTAMLPESAVTVIYAAIAVYVVWAVHPVLMPAPKPARKPHGPLVAPPAASSKITLKSLLIIANPASGPGGDDGTGRGKHLAENVAKPLLESNGIKVTIVFTERESHAYELAQSLPFDSHDGLAVVGGDGTVHEVINGMLAREDGKRLPIGIIPAGTGNSMMMDVEAVRGVVADPTEAIKVILEGFAPVCDLNRVTFGPDPVHQTAYSNNCVGYSCDQCIGAVNIDGWRSWLGMARYDVCVLWGIIKGRSFSEAAVKITVDGNVVATHCSNITINMTQHVGRGLRITPDARWNDGLLDVMGFQRERRADVLRIFGNVKKEGAHISVPGVIHAQAERVQCDFPVAEGLFNLDGQFRRFQDSTIVVECVKGAVRIFAPG